MSEINKMSGFWMGNDVVDRYYDPITGKTNKPSGRDIFALIGYQRAIGNFVRILTGENIPVTFSGTDSYTDGKSVNLSAGINNGNFDVMVGLALHEGSHIKLTDFKHLKQGIGNYISSTMYAAAKEKGIGPTQLEGLVKNLLNVVEDRRIDKYVQMEAPGYRGYYEAMYGYYFNDKVIDKCLKTNQWGKPTMDNYMNHIINFINPNRTLDALPGLRDVWNIMDLAHISRLKSTDDALATSLDMMTKLIELVAKPAPEKKQEKKQPQQGGKSEPQKTPEELIGQKIEYLGKALQAKNITPEESTKLKGYLKSFMDLL